MKRALFLAAALPLMALTACAHPARELPSKTEAAATTAEDAVSAPAGWRPFSAASPWNTKLPFDAPVDPNSDALLETFATSNPLYINIADWSVATYYIDAEAAPKRTVRSYFRDGYGRGFSTRTPVPAPDFAVPGGPAEGGTGLISLIDPATNTAWDMSQASRDRNGNWEMAFGTKVDLSGSGVSLPWMMEEQPGFSRSARASGVPLIAGLIRLDEIKAGKINHALAFAYPAPRPGKFVQPASTALETAGGAERPFEMPLGTRIQLDPSFDVENSDLSPTGKIIARALQEYGAILVDQAGASVLFAEGSPAAVREWDGLLAPDELVQVFSPEMMLRNFRVIAPEQVLSGRPRARN